MKVVVVNLDKSIDRMKIMKKQLDSLNIPFERFSAINGKELTDIEIEQTTTKTCSTLLCNRGMIGCALSHIQIMKNFLVSDEEFLCVIEDDALLSDGFPIFLSSIESIYEKIQFDWLSLFCVGICGNFESFIKVNNYTFGKPLFPLTTTCYVVSRKGAEKVLDYIGDKIFYHVDFSLSMSMLNKDLNYYILVKPNLVSTSYNNSTIGTNSKSIVLNFLEYFNLYNVRWVLNVPIFSIRMKYSFSLYFCLLFILLMIGIQTKSIFLISVSMLELFLLLSSI